MSTKKKATLGRRPLPASERGESGTVYMHKDQWAYVRARAKEERRTVRAVFEAIVDAARGVAP